MASSDIKLWKDIKKTLNETYSIPRKNIDKLGKLIKIEGNTEQVRKEIQTAKGLVYKKNLLKIIDEFCKIEKYCEWVGINSSYLYFHIGMVLQQYHTFYCGFFFKIITTGIIEEQNMAQNSSQHYINEKEVAYGGRYDNQVAHFDVPTRTSNMFAVGALINIHKITLQIAKKDQ